MNGHDQTIKLLKQEYARQQCLHQNLNQGDFARTIGIHPSTLSSLLAGRRRLSKGLASTVLEKLKTSSKMRNEILVAFDAEKVSRPSSYPKNWKAAERSFADLGEIRENDDAWESACKEYCSDLKVATLIHLIMCEGYMKHGDSWLLRKLECSKTELEHYFKTLLTLGVIKRVGDKFARTDKLVFTKRGSRKEEHKSLVEQLTDKIKTAASLPVEKRFFYNWVAAIDPKDVPAISKEIERVILRYNRMLRVTESKEVYTFLTALVPITELDDQNS